MNRAFFASALASLVLALSTPACVVVSGEGGDDIELLASSRGNGAPSGPHYNLNIIGVPTGKSPDLTGGDGHRIFVPLSGSSKINLREGEFAVLDTNATDGTGELQLPVSDADGGRITSYSVYSRALGALGAPGAPGGSSTTTTCATAPDTGEVVCSTLSSVLIRSTGGSKLTNVSRELLFAVVDIDGDGHLDKVSLFDDRLQDYFWQSDNMGLRLAQLRFYPDPTDTN